MEPALERVWLTFATGGKYDGLRGPRSTHAAADAVGSSGARAVYGKPRTPHHNRT
jgi:hypothetical protein